MFSITGISLRDFKSYRGEHEFEFPTQPGLYFLTGKNRFEPNLGSNGAGKSTLLDAIYWCLYGRSLRGLKAGDVVSWGGSGCSVSVQLTVAGDPMVVTRTQSPNSLTLALSDAKHIVDQTTLLKYIVLNEEAFIYSVVVPQFGQSFFELKPAEKLTLFSQINNLDFWLEKSQQAAKASGVLEKQIEREKSALIAAVEMMASIDADLEDLTEKKDAFEQTRQNELKVLRTNLLHLQSEVEKLDDEKAKLRSKVASCERMIVSTEANIEKAINDCHDKNLIVSKLQTDIWTVEASLKAIEKVGAKCPTCLQTVDKRHLRSEK